MPWEVNRVDANTEGKYCLGKLLLQVVFMCVFQCIPKDSKVEYFSYCEQKKKKLRNTELEY
jgi:hypothetical protein